MQTFDEITPIPFTREQLDCHIAALVTHIKRMERRTVQYDIRIDELMEAGGKDNLKEAQSLYAKKQERLQRIAETKKELARMREIFEGMNYGKAAE
ncbi:MAG: hypothetical protein IKA32_05240 [Lentisphaeria bacterium]|nr:hypothetical protein [Lentisphaeria bacterium]